MLDSLSPEGFEFEFRDVIMTADTDVCEDGDGDEEGDDSVGSTKRAVRCRDVRA
jgi:hypothetical protein